MSYTFTITCSTTEEIERLLAALRHDADPAVVEQVQTAAVDATARTQADGTPPATDTPKPRRGRPPRERATEPAAPATDAANAPARDTGASEANATSAQQPTIDNARGALRDLQARIGEADMATALGVLSKFGANRISEVKVEDYPAFIDACTKAG